ncbi:MAG: L-seryl-tRNA(Sec) selenium transferase [Acidobacteriota bacterium]|jgi:L-seryl-tRNA(Ser) seleniumtransferase|nr:L-seryl-tRNA(Sec) selenium transferase [Acidobacteriota bacterium]
MTDTNEQDAQDLFRRIPKVDQLLLRPAVAECIAFAGRELVVAEIQRLLGGLRDAIRAQVAGTRAAATDLLDAERLERALADNVRDRLTPVLRPVINATGVVLHTNLGRAPLSDTALGSLSALSRQYANLEYDISEGCRSQRDRSVQSLLQETLGCEAATVVNNNAAAVFLILDTLARGKEVVVSRGELVEIGGSFRVPDIMARSGAILREVGTTNKTHLGDYEAAITPDTALLLRVHPSNFKMRGFTTRPGLGELAELARRRGVPLVEDIGSGCLADLRPYGIADEPMVRESLDAGVALVSFSGDKLLGGPQAGVIAGEEKLVAPIRRNPLMRTYRVDKLVYGALQATLDSYRRGRALAEVPVLRMISMTKGELARRARGFARRLRAALPEDVRVRVIDGDSVIGGGSCPDCFLPTKLVALESGRARPAAVEARLRSGEPPAVIRVEEDRALIDLRTVFPEQEAVLVKALARAVE